MTDSDRLPEVVLCVDGHMPQLHGKKQIHIDLEALEHPVKRAHLDACAKAYLQQANGEYGLESAAEYIWRALLVRTHEQAGWTQPELEAPYQLSAAPSQNAIIRRGARLLAMVHELHKTGYQHLRASPFRHYKSGHWVCQITCASNLECEASEATAHLPFTHDASYALQYSSADGAHYFGWTDIEGKTARELAALFLQRFPSLAERSKGQDWTYAGWLTSILGIAESGKLPVTLGASDETFAAVPVPPPPSCS